VARRLTTGLAVGAALLVAVLAFLAATLLSEMALARLHSAAHSIVTNAGPSLRRLNAIGRNVETLQHRMELLAGASAPDWQAESKTLLRLSSNIEHHWREYQRQPVYLGEPALSPAIDADLRLLRAAAEETHRVPSAEALHERLGSVNAAVARLDETLGHQIRVNSSALGTRVAAIREAREAHVARTLLLNLLAIVSALAAGLLAYRAIRRYELLLESRTAELEQFAGRLAHDLLSPMSSAATALELLREVPTDPRTRRIVEAGHRGLQRARDVADALLAFAAAGGRATGGERAMVEEVLPSVAAELRPTAEEAGVELIVCPAADLAVACTPTLLGIALDNLVSNSIKYMGDRPVRRVTLAARRDRRTVRIEVEDTGPGMPPQTRSRLFEPFVRGASDQPGFGLGLATVKRIAEGHGGDVEVDSRPGQGSRFTLILPAA
jgi:signal transduction histidine kinase